MKNIIIWLCGICIGGLAGYGIGWLQSSTPYLWMAIGIILGSTIAITHNIHREKEELEDDVEFEDLSEPKKNDETQQKINRRITS